MSTAAPTAEQRADLIIEPPRIPFSDGFAAVPWRGIQPGDPITVRGVALAATYRGLCDNGRLGITYANSIMLAECAPQDAVVPTRP